MTLGNEFADAVVAVIPEIARLIPASPAATIGRLGIDGSELRAPDERHRISEVASGLRQLLPTLTERLFGALELSVGGIEVPLPAGVTDHLTPPGNRMLSFASSSSDTETTTALSRFDGFVPGASDLVLALVRELAGQPTIASVLRAATGDDETAVAAAHGRVYLGLTVAVAAAVARFVPIALSSFEATVVGLALGCANIVLREVPMPDSYAAAVLAKRRAEYRYPQRSSFAVEVHDHRLVLATDPSAAPPVEFSGNGLVTAIDGGAVIRTGIADGTVHCTLVVRADPEEEPMLVGWDEVVDVSWHTETGDATLEIVRGGAGQLRTRRRGTPPWPGDYRLRVHATGRDGDDSESYHLVIWPQPMSPDTIHQRTDRLGHRLRGEPQPDVTPPPEAAYRWLDGSVLGDAATVTVVTGMALDEVIRAFGGDPDEPVEADEYYGDPPTVMVARIGDAVLAVEINGYQGVRKMRELSVKGAAASMFWNVNAVTRLSFARQGIELASFEPDGEEVRGQVELDVVRAVAGLDFDDYRHLYAKGVTAVTRFIGCDFTAQDVQDLRVANVAYLMAE